MGSSPAGCFVDVGAHVGFFALYAAALGHQVHAFEPAQHHITAIKRSLQLNGPDLPKRFHLHEKIVADRKGKMPFSTFPIGPDGSSFASVKSAKTTDDSEQVDVARVSDVVQQSVDVMKIDVEGCEMQALRSSLRLIAGGNMHNMLVEVCPYLWPRCGSTWSDAERVFGQLLAQGFYLYIYDGDKESTEFFSKSEPLPQVDMPGDDYKLFVLPNELKELLRMLRLQAKAQFCNHVWVTPAELYKDRKPAHTEL